MSGVEVFPSLPSFSFSPPKFHVTLICRAGHVLFVVLIGQRLACLPRVLSLSPRAPVTDNAARENFIVSITGLVWGWFRPSRAGKTYVAICLPFFCCPCCLFLLLDGRGHISEVPRGLDESCAGSRYRPVPPGSPGSLSPPPLTIDGLVKVGVEWEALARYFARNTSRWRRMIRAVPMTFHSGFPKLT